MFNKSKWIMKPQVRGCWVEVGYAEMFQDLEYCEIIMEGINLYIVSSKYKLVDRKSFKHVK